MTRKLLSLIPPLLLLVFVSTASAENTTTGSAQTTAGNTSKLQQQIQILQEQKKAAISQVRDEVKAMIAAKRDEFKAKLQTIRDQRKKILVERIDTKLAQVNKKHTDRFFEVLTRLQTFLDKISQTTKDERVLAQVKTAQAAIDKAVAAVEAQAAKTYTIQITDEITLKLNVGTTTSQLRQDLMATHKLVVDAKQAVQKLNTDKSMMKKEATGSAKTNL